jgi:hypothetical protein
MFSDHEVSQVCEYIPIFRIWVDSSLLCSKESRNKVMPVLQCRFQRPLFQNCCLQLPRKRDAEEAEITVPEAKKFKLDLVGLPEPQQSASFPPTPMSEDNSSRPLISDTLEADVQVVSDMKKTTFKGKPKLSDPSFKEMPYTFLKPNDPTLLSCMCVFLDHRCNF